MSKPNALGPLRKNVRNGWVLPNHPEFHQFINERFSKFALKPVDDSENPCMCPSCGKPKKRCSCAQEIKFFPHQQFVSAYLNKKTPYRGLLLYHGLGSGKTLSAISVAEGHRDERDVVVILPASLKSNFIHEIQTYAKYHYSKQMTIKEIEKKYTFISHNASNFAEKLEDTDLDNKIIIVDEAHNLISLIVGKGKQSDRVYKKLMEMKNSKLIFLTGTPIINSPFECAIMFNLLRGYINEDGSMWDGSGPRMAPFPEDADTFFSSYFSDGGPDNRIDMVKLLDSAKYRFISKMFGLVSYYVGVQGKGVYPEINQDMNVKCSMSNFQYNMYQRVRAYEAEKEKILKRSAKDMILSVDFDDSSKTKGIFRVFSRQICNFAFPEEIPRPYPSEVDFDEVDKPKKKREKIVGNTRTAAEKDKDRRIAKKAKDEVYQANIEKALQSLENSEEDYLSRRNLPKYSPKMAAILDKIDEMRKDYANDDDGTFPKGNVVIYSFFKTVEGVRIMSMALKANGYAPYNDYTTGPAVPRYAVYDGTNDEVINIFNSEENMHGYRIKVLLISSSGAEGISLYNVRQIHLLDPYWHDVQTEQVIGRAFRLCSHVDLPADKQNVSIYRYFSVFADDQEKFEENTTDEFVAMIAAKKKSLADEILMMMKSVAVDCTLNLIHNRMDRKNKGLRCMYARNPMGISDEIKGYLKQTNSEDLAVSTSAAPNVSLANVAAKVNKGKNAASSSNNSGKKSMNRSNANRSNANRSNANRSNAKKSNASRSTNKKPVKMIAVRKEYKFIPLLVAYNSSGKQYKDLAFRTDKSTDKSEYIKEIVRKNSEPVYSIDTQEYVGKVKFSAKDKKFFYTPEK